MGLLGWLRRRPDPAALRPLDAPAVRVRRVLVTGAAGQVAGLVLPLLRAQADHWRLADQRSEGMPSWCSDVRVLPLGPGHDAGVLLDDVDAVVHLAGQAKPAAPDVLHARNVELLQWLLDAMRSAGVRRLVHASSMHVMGRYTREERVTPDLPPRPSDAYGESKLAGESRIAAACDAGSLDALVLRIGHVTARAAEAEPANWLAADDLARLIAIGIARPPAGLTIVHAVTPHAGDDMGQAAFAQRTGMQWRSDAPAYRESRARLASWYGDDVVARALRGGVFASGRAAG